MSLGTAAEFAGVARGTAHRWKQTKPKFRDAVEKAIAKGQAAMTTRLVEEARKGNITAMIFWLKNRTEEFREKKGDDVEAAAVVLAELLKRIRSTIPDVDYEGSDEE